MARGGLPLKAPLGPLGWKEDKEPSWSRVRHERLRREMAPRWRSLFGRGSAAGIPVGVIRKRFP